MIYWTTHLVQGKQSSTAGLRRPTRTRMRGQHSHATIPFIHTFVNGDIQSTIPAGKARSFNSLDARGRWIVGRGRSVTYNTFGKSLAVILLNQLLIGGLFDSTKPTSPSAPLIGLSHFNACSYWPDRPPVVTELGNRSCPKVNRTLSALGQPYKA